VQSGCVNIALLVIRVEHEMRIHKEGILNLGHYAKNNCVNSARKSSENTV